MIQRQFCSRQTVRAGDISAAGRSSSSIAPTLSTQPKHLERLFARTIGRSGRHCLFSTASIERAQIFVNPGFKNPGRWEPEFEVVRSTDHDCDHWVVSSAVAALASGAQVLVVVSGDHRFVEIAEVSVRLGVKFISIGVPGCTNRRLKTDFRFHPLPTFEIPTVAA